MTAEVDAALEEFDRLLVRKKREHATVTHVFVEDLKLLVECARALHEMAPNHSDWSTYHIGIRSTLTDERNCVRCDLPWPCPTVRGRRALAELGEATVLA